MTSYGRSEAEWDELVRIGTTFLRERARLGAVTTYTEMNTVLVRRTGQRSFDFSLDSDRAAMGHLLELITLGTIDDRNVMLSSLVKYLNDNDAGPGFYGMAERRGLLPRNASRQAKSDFWIQQVAQTHEVYGARP